MAADPDVAAVALRLADDPAAVVHTGERGCAVTSLQTASHDAQVAARRLVASGPPLVAYDVLGLGLRLTDGGSPLDVAMRYVEPAVRLLSLAAGGRQPKRPEMYASVAGSSGLEKILRVVPNSTSRPGLPVPARLKKAVSSDTRPACCMLWVTITIV